MSGTELHLLFLPVYLLYHKEFRSSSRVNSKLRSGIESREILYLREFSLSKDAIQIFIIYNRLGELIHVLNSEKKTKHMKYLSMSGTSSSLLYFRRIEWCVERTVFIKILAKVLKDYGNINTIII